VNHTITLLDTKIASNLPIFTVPDKYRPKYKERRAKWKAAGTIYPSASHNPVNTFPKLKPNGELRLLADLVPPIKITLKDHAHITNQVLILSTLGRVKYASTIDSVDRYVELDWNQNVKSTTQS
jgi:hypothetical protein